MRVCPYLRPEWHEVFEHSGMSSAQVLAVWRKRDAAVKGAGLFARKGARYLNSGAANPYMSELAWRVMFSDAKKHSLSLSERPQAIARRAA